MIHKIREKAILIKIHKDGSSKNNKINQIQSDLIKEKGETYKLAMRKCYIITNRAS